MRKGTNGKEWRKRDDRERRGEDWHSNPHPPSRNPGSGTGAKNDKNPMETSLASKVESIVSCHKAYTVYCFHEFRESLSIIF